VVKILGFSFAGIATVLAAVFMLLSWQTRARLQRAIVANVESSQERFGDLEERLQLGQRLQAATLAENPTLKAAVDTYQTEGAFGGPKDQLRNTLRLELGKLAQTVAAPVLAVIDIEGVILASSGPAQKEWAAGSSVTLPINTVAQPVETIVARANRPFHATVVPLVLGVDVVGHLVLATAVDAEYARRLQREAGTDIAVVHNGRLVAASVGSELESALRTVALPENGTLKLGDEEYVVRRLRLVDTVQVFAIESVTAAVREATREAAAVFVVIGFGALVLAALASFWLARTLASPIDELRTTLAQMAQARDFERELQPSGVSFELDALTQTFDQLRAAVSAAEAESENTYLGVIGALAAALDARDPYTAGHSERVAHLSVAIGHQMGLSEDELEVLRLGALLHDIGKIGVSDAVLRKPGTLTDDELEQIKRHPSLGARILRPLNFLSEHIAIVELHHEQPDGCGYPFGLKGEEVPLFARIVHVADAFDAMTTARAYRPGRPATEAIAELWRCAGTGFDLAVVQAMAAVPAAVLIRAATRTPPGDTEATATVGGSLVPFRLRAAGVQARRTAG
jgi:putative nucleotidyltransferase with HDIG domain